MIFDCRTLEVIFANLPIRQMVKGNIPLRIVNNSLCFVLSSFKHEFMNELRVTMSNGKDATILCCRKDVCGTPVLLSIHLIGSGSKLSLPMDQQFRDRELAILECHCPEYEPDQDAIQALSDELCLTPCERRDLTYLASGKTIEEIARLTDVKSSTVRSRIKSLLSKSGYVRKQELVSLVMSLCPRSVNVEQSEITAPHCVRLPKSLQAALA